MGLADIDRDLASPPKTAPARPLAEFAGAPFQPKTTLGKGIMETLGYGTRAGARTPVKVLTKPEGVAEHIAQAAVEVPLVMIGGALMPAAVLPAWIGRIAMSGALGAAKAGAQDKSVGWGMLLDLAASSVVEAGAGASAKALKIVSETGGVKKALATFAEHEAAFKWAGEAPKQAIAALKGRFPKAKIVIPSIDPAKKLTLEQAAEELGKREGPSYQVTRSEIIDWLNRLEASMKPAAEVAESAARLAKATAKQLGTTTDDPMVRKLLEANKLIAPGAPITFAAPGATVAPPTTAGELFATATSPFRRAPTPVTRPPSQALADVASRTLTHPLTRATADVVAPEEAILPLADVASMTVSAPSLLRYVRP